MSKISLLQRLKPIDQYLDREKRPFNELLTLQEKGMDFYIRGLSSDPQKGLSPEKVVENSELYGRNELSKKRLKTFFELLCKSLEDLMLRILIGSAIISIIVEGIYSKERSTFWLEGVTILAAVAVCSIVASVNDFQKQKQFEELNQIAERNNKFDLVRGGQLKEVCKDEIVVGDIIRITSGLQIPVDGILVKANDMIVDESSMTGQSHQVYRNVLEKCVMHGTNNKKAPSPMIISGSKIMSGEGYMLCLLVGKEHRQGMLNELIQEDNDEHTPLQEKLDDLATKIGLFGIVSGALLFLVLLLWLLINEIIPNGWDSSKHIADILNYLMLAVVIIVVAVPEGLPLAVTLSLAFSVKQMLLENNLVKRLACCETMGSAHVICTDKTGTLTQNDMHVVHVWNGTNHRGPTLPNALDSHLLGDAYRRLVFSSIANNSSAVLQPKIKGSPTEVALLRYAQQLYPSINVSQWRSIHENNYFIRMPFNSDRKRITTGLKIDGVNYLFLTGASEIVIDACTEVYDVRDKRTGKTRINRSEIEQQIEDMTRRGLRVVALAVKVIDGPLPNPDDPSTKDKFGVRDIEKQDFALMLLAGIQDLPRPESREAIRMCNRAGVVVIMVTGDNSVTARSVADELGITRPDDKTPGLCMQGDEFERLERNSSPEEFYKKIKHLKVLARSRPEHKYKLVEGLKKINNVVAVTGDGTNDAPALLKADVGVAMGISGTQVAKNAADILILDDNFNSIVRSIVWGRNIYDSTKKFLQFQLTTNGVACVISIVSSALFKQSVFTTVQMLWVNMIMDSLASLALSTEPPNSQELLRRKPVNRSDSLITPTMIKHIVIQSIYQIALLLFLVVEGQKFLPEYRDGYDDLIGTDLEAKYYLGQVEGTMANGLDHPLWGDYSYATYFDKYHVYSRHLTFVFNVFVFLQIFNFFNCRRIYDELNLLTGLFTNYIFWLMFAFISLFEFVIIQFLNVYFKCYNYGGLTVQQWLLSLLMGASVIPLSILIRLLPIAKPKLDYNSNDEANDLQFRSSDQVREQPHPTRENEK